MNIVVESYLNEILKPRLELYGVSAGYIGEISAENKQVFFVDCFKMLSHNPEKLFATIEYLLANDELKEIHLSHV